jgi:hypothetical protein
MRSSPPNPTRWTGSQLNRPGRRGHANCDAACYLLAQPVPGIGIAIPSLVPPIIAAIASFLVAHRSVAAVAYASGSLGTLIGADLLNLGKIQGGAPIVSIGGAGTFDGVFLMGILAVPLGQLLRQSLNVRSCRSGRTGLAGLASRGSNCAAPNVTF